MGERNAGTVAIRLDLRGQEELKRRLEALGSDGSRIFRDLEHAAKPVSTQFNVVNEAGKSLTSGLQDMARQSGPVGGFLTSIGPWGIAAGLGIAALTFAVREAFVLMGQARDTALFAEELRTVEDAAGLTSQRLLVLGSAVEMAGGEFQAGLSSLEEFSKRLGEFRTTGQGEGRDAFQVLGLDAFAATEAPLEDVLDRVLGQLAQIDDPARRLSIADKLGLRDAAPLLQQSAEDLERILGTASDINAAFSVEVLARFADAAARIHELQTRQERARQLQSLAGLDMELTRERALAEFEEAKARLLNGRLPVERQALELLQQQAGAHDEIMASLQRRARLTGLDAEQRSRIQTALTEELHRHQEITAELERRQRLAVIDEDREQRRQQELGRRAIGAPDTPTTPPLALDRRRQLEGLLEQSLRAIQTPLQQVAQLEADLNEARENGVRIGGEGEVITRAQIAAILDHRRAALGLIDAVKSLTDEERKLQGVLAAQIDPLERQKELLESLTAPSDEARARLVDLYAVLAQSPEHADVIVAEIARVKAALDGGDGSVSGVGGNTLEDRFGGLRKMAEDAGDLASQLDRVGTNSLRDFNDYLTDLAMGAENAGDSFEDMSRRVIAAMIEMVIQQQITGPLAEFGANFLSNLFSPGSGGGAKVTAGVKHAGGDVGGSGPSRTVAASIFARAPYAHNGLDLLPGEHPIIAKDGERVLNEGEASAWRVIERLGRQQNATAGQAASAGGRETLEIQLVDKSGGRIKATERRSPGGGRVLELMFEEQVGSMLGNGTFDDELASRYGLSPATGRR